MSAVWLGKPLTVSNSEIQTFKDCRRKWYLTYYRELGLRRSKDKFVGPRNLGTKIHLALEGLYGPQAMNPITLIDELYTEDERILHELDRSGEVIDLKKEQDLAHAMLEGFLAWREEEAIDAGMELVAAESVIQVKSGTEGVLLRGKLDQRWHRRIDGRRLFRDFKTVVEMKTPVMMLPLDEQMKFYHLLEFLEALEKTGSEPQWRTDGGMYTMLRKVKRTMTAKPPFYGQAEVHHNMTELKSMWKRVHKILEEIVLTRQALSSGGDHQYITPPRPSRDCTWKCDFLPVCPMMDDGSNWEGLIDEYYTHVDPHERYKAQDEGKEVTE